MPEGTAIVTVGRSLTQQHYTARVIRVIAKTPLTTVELFRCSHKHRTDADARACPDAMGHARSANKKP